MKAYYHVLMVNNWKEIVAHQLSLVDSSGLYDELDSITIGCLGSEKDKKTLESMLRKFKKVKIKYHSTNKEEYEFPTLNLLYNDCHKYDDEPFAGLYFHTKSVTEPKSNGGRYWRDYMNYYNISCWAENVRLIDSGFDLSGVKLIQGATHSHYSGNYFWFRSDYVHDNLRSPLEMNMTDRFQAEFWIGGGSHPEFACLSDEFVDHNTSGQFIEPRNFVHTLCYNLVSEVEKTTKRLYAMNDNFEHIIVDLGFPLEKGHVIPKDIELAKKKNSEKLRRIAENYGSHYFKIDNVGVSQNWTAVYKKLKMHPMDILIGADPDERPQTENWVEAMATVLRSKHKVGMAVLAMPEQKFLYSQELYRNGVKFIIPHGNINWALIGFRGDFLDAMGGVPVPQNADKYGWIEGAVFPYFAKLKYKIAVLPHDIVVHTDYEHGDKGTSRLLREWKNLIVFKIKQYGQISFDEFLERKKKGEF